MANVIRITVKKEWFEGSTLRKQDPLKAYSIATTSDVLDFEKTQVVGTSHEAIDAGDVTDDAYAQIENVHATAVIQVGIDDAATFVPIIDINPGDPPAVIPRASSLAGLYLESDTASTPVRITLVKIVAPA